jgi:hypothetical protein
MKNFLCVVVGIMMFTIFSSFFNFFFGSGLSSSSKMGHKIASEVGKELSAKYGLHYAGISEKGTKEKYEILGLELYCKRRLSKDEGRRLLLQCSQEALEAFNSYPQFRQYMINYPFTGKNIIIHIYSQPIKKSFHPDIAVFLFFDNTLSYKTKSPQNRFEYFSVVEETIEEAKRIIASQKAKGHNDLE